MGSKIDLSGLPHLTLRLYFSYCFFVKSSLQCATEIINLIDTLLAPHSKLTLVLIFGNFMEVLTIFYPYWEKENRNEVSCVHVVKSYCVPSLAYGCEIWNLSCAQYRHMNVLWNDTFRKIFNCCWRESTKQLLFYCEVLPMSYIIDKCKKNCSLSTTYNGKMTHRKQQN